VIKKVRKEEDMNLRSVSAKYKRKVKKTVYASPGFAGVLLAAGVLFTVLVLSGGAAEQSAASESSVIGISEIQTLSINATPDSQDYSRSRVIAKWQESAEREAAAERFKANYTAVQGANVTKVAPMLMPGATPHYFGPYPNYANSPMPKGAITGITLASGGSGYSLATAAVTITDLYNTGTGATATVTAVDPTTGAITAIELTNGGAGYTAPVVTIADTAVPPAGTGATAMATIGGTLTGGIRKFVDSLPGLDAAGANNLGQFIPVAIPDTTTYPPGGKGYTSAPTVSISDATGTGATATASVDVGTGTVTSVTVTNGGSGYSANPTITFSDGGATTQAIGKASVVDGVITEITLVGCDYYEIELGAYTEQMHSDLPATKLYGYRQTNTADPTVSQFHYMGPLIIAERDRPVRIKFTNNLPTGEGGDLFLPVDTTVMGAGMGPNMIMPAAAAQVGGAGTTVEIETMAPHNLQAGQLVMLHGFTPDAYNGEFRVLSVADAMHFQVTLNSDPGGPATVLGHITEMYTQNRATLHLHGGYVPWISDGTPHQWTTPAGEKTSYPKGVSVRNVPDMPDPGDGSLTFYYNNQQSARLQFYHDHAYGITRLNVYAGEAAGYLITDQVEKDMIDGTDVSGVNPTNAMVLPDLGIPLVIQDRTFVDSDTIAMQDPTWSWGSMPGMPMTGDLWYPHVYMPNQNPADAGGMNAFGRWHFGPWFWPPTQGITYPPIQNPYYDPVNAPWENKEIPATPNPSMAMEAFMDTPIVNGAAYPNLTVEPRAYRFRILNAADDRFLNLQLYQASTIISGITVTNGGSGYTDPKVEIKDTPPGTGKGATAEAIVDSVTGAITGITLLTVGSNYTAPIVTITDATGTGAAATAAVYTGQTEVGMVPASTCAGLPAGWPTDGRGGGVPDPDTAGPSFIQIGSEGGFLPAPVELPNLPVGWNFDQTNFDFGNVNQGTLILGTAERADVIVDFSQYAGKTLILYNDAPAPFPAIDPRYDYYTGHPDMTDTGGAPTTQPGYGPNTRTIMQIKVLDSPVSPAYDLPALEAVFAKTATKKGVFEASQDEIIVPQADYDSAYNKNFPADTYTRIFDGSKTFETVSGDTVTLSMEPKAIQDEMGETYDTEYGRMSAMLGLQLPVTAGVQAFTMYPYPSPPVEIIKGSVYGTPIGVEGDGTQIWKITHNGVDTHTIHVHLFNAQLINRVAWDNAIRVPDANELGWKETFRVNPLQDTIIALRPTAPTQPFSVPNSTRPIDPTMPLGEPLKTPPGGFKDPNAEPVTIINHLVNYGWEYVWHCHLLAHEEMDMMHAMAFAVPPEAPSDLVAALGNSVTVTWKDNSAGETGFTIQRATDVGFTTDLTTFTVGPNVVTYTDTTVVEGTTYYYRVMANNVVGDTAVYAAPSVGFPTKSVDSAFSNTAEIYVPVAIAAPTNLQARITGPARITLTWIDASNNEAKFVVWRSNDGGTTYAPIGEVLRNAAESAAVGGTVTFADTGVAVGQTYMYYVTAVNAAGLSPANATTVTAPNVGGSSPPSNTVTIAFSAPAAPSGLTGTAVRTGTRYTVTLNWIDNANNEDSFRIQRSISPNFSRPTTYSVGADATTFVNQNVARYSRGYYYRVQAVNVLGPSGWAVVHVNTP
jgi:FtsP/CotA-like multicopper oxidase with cupredoxin domain